eukprot:g52.t1
MRIPGLRRSKSAWDEEHLCAAEDLGKVYTIQQAFPTIDKLGNRHTTDLPHEIGCTTCGRHLLTEDQELEFWVCRRCWSEGRVFTQCRGCREACRAKDVACRSRFAFCDDMFGGPAA